MRVLIWGINYAPEVTGIAPYNTGLGDYLVQRGHEVKMVTTFPYYPVWKKIPGDQGILYRTDDFDGVRVHRCWHYVPAAVTTLRRIGHELSFGVTSFWRVLFLSRPDLYVVVSPPLLLGPLAALMGWLKRRPYVFHVQDLQPDAAVGLGMVKTGHFTRLLYRLEGWSYRHAAVVSGISEGMIAAFTEKNVPAAKRVLFPNWIRRHGGGAESVQGEAERRQQGAAFREKFGISAAAFVASYSGNLGRKQGLETLLAAAEMLAGEAGDKGQRSEVRGQRSGASLSAVGLAKVEGRTRTSAAPEVLILVVGDGAMKSQLAADVARLGLGNVRLLPLLVESDYQGMLAASDVSLILQAAGTGRYFFPSKLLSVLAVRSPVLTVADDDSELARAVQTGGFGVNVPPGAPRALSEVLRRLAADPAQLGMMRSKTDWVNRYAAGAVLPAFEERLREVARATA